MALFLPTFSQFSLLTIAVLQGDGCLRSARRLAVGSSCRTWLRCCWAGPQRNPSSTFHHSVVAPRCHGDLKVDDGHLPAARVGVARDMPSSQQFGCTVGILPRPMLQVSAGDVRISILPCLAWHGVCGVGEGQLPAIVMQ